MNCNVIQDLMMLYADNCCSDDSKAIVEEHIKNCAVCKKAYEEMTAIPTPAKTAKKAANKKFTQINSWKASLLQSVLLLVSFALIIFGVAREAATPSGDANGLWAIAVIIPAAGFMLSLANWYFIRVYPSRNRFSVCSLITTVVLILLGDVWAILHYKGIMTNLFHSSVPSTTFLVIGCSLSVALCVISKILSDRYAKLLGKE